MSCLLKNCPQSVLGNFLISIDLKEILSHYYLDQKLVLECPGIGIYAEPSSLLHSDFIN